MSKKTEISKMYSIPKTFADKQLKYCPICGKENCQWEIEDEWVLFDRNYFYKCPTCKSVLQVTESDITGLSFTTHSFVGQMKSFKKKDNKSIYIKCKRIGNGLPKKKYLQGDEFTIEELYEEYETLKEHLIDED